MFVACYSSLPSVHTLSIGLVKCIDLEGVSIQCSGINDRVPIMCSHETILQSHCGDNFNVSEVYSFNQLN